MKRWVKALLLVAFVGFLATPATVFTSEDVAPSARRQGGEKFEFQAEVNRLMDIIIHSLYTNKDIFLRELISNASDALDKLRFLSLTDKSVLGEGETANLEIKISLDKEKKILSIRDRGIGMTKDDLIKNLGTIAKSGTSSFLEAMQKGGDMNLIGQFGVGFYSVYLVADWVEVVTKHNDDKQYIWASSADGGFSIEEDTENEDIGRGTIVKLHLKDEAVEYAQEYKLKELVKTYSEFINFPIYMLTEKEVDVPIEEDEPQGEAVQEEEYEDIEDEDGAEDEEEQEAPKTRKEMRMEWDLLNDNKAIWLRSPSDVTEEEHTSFYKAVSKDYQAPLTHLHFKAEGDVEFKSLLYIPMNAPFDFYDKYYEGVNRQALKLYVRRVFISDDTKELIPRWLSFVKGVVDSDTLPLSVSRETLQSHAALKTIKKKLVRKLLDEFKKLADDEVKCKEQEKLEEDGESIDDEDRLSNERCSAFGVFYRAFGRALKLGIIEDSTNRNRIAKLLRFHSSKAEDEKTSLEDYVSRMKEGQKDIYFMAGSSMKEIKDSPFMEKLLKKDYEVLYMVDVLDEYLMQHMVEFDDHKFSNIAKEDLKLAEQDEKTKKKDKQLKDEFKPLTKWFKGVLPSSEVSKVLVSSRLQSSPCVVVAGKYGQSANMERIARAQAFSDPNKPSMSSSQRVFEINPRHPMMKTIKEKFEANPDDENLKDQARIMYETALLESGFLPVDQKAFAKRLYSLLGASVGVADMNAIEEDSDDEENEFVEVEEEEEDDLPKSVLHDVSDEQMKEMMKNMPKPEDFNKGKKDEL